MQQQTVQMQSLQDRLVRQSPKDAIAQRKQAVTNSVKQMMRAVAQQLEIKQSKTAQAMHLLDTVSPLKTLGRGYSIIRDENNKVIKTVAEVKAGDQLKGQLVDGELTLAVSATNNNTP
jgi:exodeoxyribonuclease VII large subunit